MNKERKRKQERKNSSVFHSWTKLPEISPEMVVKGRVKARFTSLALRVW